MLTSVAALSASVRTAVLLTTSLSCVSPSLHCIISHQLTKESNVQPDGVLVTAARDGRPSEVVQTASFQSAPTRLHSALPDEAFEKLKIFSANSTVSGSHVSLQVLGFARVQGPGICGNVVEILTAAGQITLDGATMTFASEVGDVFVEAR